MCAPLFPHPVTAYSFSPSSTGRLCPHAPSTSYRVLLVELYAPHPSDRSHIYRATTLHFSHHPPFFPFLSFRFLMRHRCPTMHKSAGYFSYPLSFNRLGTRNCLRANTYSLWGMSSSCWQLEPIHNRNNIPKRSSLSSMRRNIISTVLNNYFSNFFLSLPFSLLSARSLRKPLFLAIISCDWRSIVEPGTRDQTTYRLDARRFNDLRASSIGRHRVRISSSRSSSGSISSASSLLLTNIANSRNPRPVTRSHVCTNICTYKSQNRITHSDEASSSSSLMVFHFRQ